MGVRTGRLCSAVGWALVMGGMVGCGLPRDPMGTLDRARGGTLRVGTMREPPWTACGGGAVGPCGVEVELVERLARELDAEVAWVHGGESRLMGALEHFELDVVIGGVTDATAWKSRVALTKPWVVRRPAGRELGAPGEERHVLALPPGENGWLLHVERFLARDRARAGRRYRERREEILVRPETAT